MSIAYFGGVHYGIWAISVGRQGALIATYPSACWGRQTGIYLLIRVMVDLSGSNSVLQHSFDNSVFIIPALIIVAIVGEWNSLFHQITIL